MRDAPGVRPALRGREQALLEAIVASAGDGFYAVDVEGRLTFTNPAAERLLGWGEDDLLGRSAHAAFHHQRPDGTPLPDAECALLGVLRDGEPVRIDEVFTTRDGRLLDVTCSSSPITEDERVVGAVMSFHDVTEQRAIERRLRQEARINELLVAVGNTFGAELDLDRIVQTVVDVATELSGAEFGAFFYNRVDERGESYTLYTLSGAPRSAFEKFPLPRNTPVFEPTFHGDGVVRSDDITKDERYGRLPPYHGMPPGHLPVRSYLAVPVVSTYGAVLGGLFFGHSAHGVFSDADEQLLRGLAAQAAIAIDNASLYETAQTELAARRRGEDLQRLLADVSAASALFIRADAARRVLDLVVPVLCDACVLVLGDGVRADTCHVAAAEPAIEAFLVDHCAAHDGEEPAFGALARTITAGTTRLVEDVTTDELADADERRHLADRGVRSALYIPLIARARVLGAIGLLWTSERRLAEPDLPVAEELARRIALGIDNAQLYEERDAVARALQEALLPPLLPHLPHAEVAGRYQPKGSGALVGGDFYDVFQVQGDRWAIVLGDVSGSGPTAAAMTGLVRHTIRAVSAGDPEPAHVLASVNRAVLDQHPDESFCTAAYALLTDGDEPRAETLDMVVACGGHPPPIVARADGRLEVVDAGGTLLGLLADIELRQVRVRLAPGDALVLYTDGVVEAQGPHGELFGEARLRQVLAGHAGEPAEQIADAVQAAAGRFQLGPRGDDVALLVVRATG